jgi:hypothetical protein
MKDVGAILTRYFQLLEKPFSRDWICDFKSMMAFVQNSPEIDHIVQAIHEEKIEDHKPLIQGLEHLLKDGRDNLKRLLSHSQNTIGFDLINPKIQALLKVTVDKSKINDPFFKIESVFHGY